MEKASDARANRRAISSAPSAAPTGPACPRADIPPAILADQRIYDAHVPITKIEALLAAADAFAMSPATGGHGHLLPTVEMLSEQMRELRRVLYGPAMGP